MVLLDRRAPFPPRCGNVHEIGVRGKEVAKGKTQRLFGLRTVLGMCPARPHSRKRVAKKPRLYDSGSASNGLPDEHRSVGSGLTPEFSCKHASNIAAKPHPKSACLLQRSLGIGRATTLRDWRMRTNHCKSSEGSKEPRNQPH